MSAYFATVFAALALLALLLGICALPSWEVCVLVTVAGKRRGVLWGVMDDEDLRNGQVCWHRSEVSRIHHIQLWSAYLTVRF